MRYQVDFTIDIIMCSPVTRQPIFSKNTEGALANIYIYQTFTFIEKVGKVLSTLTLFQLDCFTIALNIFPNQISVGCIPGSPFSSKNLHILEGHGFFVFSATNLFPIYRNSEVNLTKMTETEAREYFVAFPHLPLFWLLF